MQKAYHVAVRYVNSVSNVLQADFMDEYIDRFNKTFRGNEIIAFGRETEGYIPLERLLQRKRISLSTPIK